MERTTVIALMAAILAAPRKGDYRYDQTAEEAETLYDAVALRTRPLDGATVLGIRDDADRDDDDRNAEQELQLPATWLDVAKARGAKASDDGTFNGAELARVGVQIINGCPDCGATVAPYNSYKVQHDSDYAFCRECAENRTGVAIND
jgi:hypothetical protein